MLWAANYVMLNVLLVIINCAWALLRNEIWHVFSLPSEIYNHVKVGDFIVISTRKPQLSTWARVTNTWWRPDMDMGCVSLVCSWWCHQMETFPRYWPFVRGIHRSPVNSPHKGQWRGALMFSLICVWIIGWVNNREAGDLRRYRAHYDVIVMLTGIHLAQMMGVMHSITDIFMHAFGWLWYCNIADKFVAEHYLTKYYATAF